VVVSITLLQCSVAVEVDRHTVRPASNCLTTSAELPKYDMARHLLLSLKPLTHQGFAHSAAGRKHETDEGTVGLEAPALVPAADRAGKELSDDTGRGGGPASGNGWAK
jgi:hypothetical protein